jgi:hypothetical protein
MLIMAVAGDSGWENHRLVIEVDHSSGVGTTTSLAGAKEVKMADSSPMRKRKPDSSPSRSLPAFCPWLASLDDRSSTSAMRGRDRRC